MNNQFNTEIKLDAREFYNFRLLAINNKVHFSVRWEKMYAVVTCETPFLIAYGYIDKIDF